MIQSNIALPRTIHAFLELNKTMNYLSMIHSKYVPHLHTTLKLLLLISY
jgi:hypothetical protein